MEEKFWGEVEKHAWNNQYHDQTFLVSIYFLSHGNLNHQKFIFADKILNKMHFEAMGGICCLKQYSTEVTPQ